MKTKTPEINYERLNRGLDKNSVFYTNPGDITIVKDWKPVPKDDPFLVEKRRQGIACFKEHFNSYKEAGIIPKDAPFPHDLK